MAVDSTGTFSGSLLTSAESEAMYLLSVADRNGFFMHPVFSAGYLGRTGSTTRLERMVYGLGADEMTAETEGTGGTGVAISNTKIGATVAGQILVRENTQLLRNLLGQMLSPDQLVGFDAAVAASTRVLSMVITAGQSATTSTTTTATDLTVATFMAALAAYIAKGSFGPGAVVQPIFIGHPNQVQDLATDLLLNSGGQLQYGDEGRRMAALTGGAFKGEINGTQVFQSTRIPTANAGADSSGLLLGPGAVAWADMLPLIDSPSTQRVLGGEMEPGVVPPMLAEYDRDAKGGITATVARIFFGAEYDSARDLGHKVITDR